MVLAILIISFMASIIGIIVSNISTIISNISIIISTVSIILSILSIIVSIINIIIHGSAPLKNKNSWACQPCIKKNTVIIFEHFSMLA